MNPILIVTANDNETEALFKCPKFVKNSALPVAGFEKDDHNYYYEGKMCGYDVVQFQLNEQGSVKSDASGFSVNGAIKKYSPCAIIMLGVALGCDKKKQRIGDVLISERIIDYESGKIKEDGSFRSDAAIPDAGPQLLAACKNCKKLWNHKIGNRVASVHVGNIVSGDKVIDSEEFKKGLPIGNHVYVGGEMEGRGLYSVCRRVDLQEWIIIKAICDWGVNKGANKEANQKKAAASAVSFLQCLFESKFLDKIYGISAETKKKDEALTKNYSIVGYIIQFGTTTCRVYEKLNRKKKSLKEKDVICYSVSDTSDPEYLDGIIDQVKSSVLPLIDSTSNVFIKTFADPSFLELFGEKKMSVFVNEFYRKTGLFFNIVSQQQTANNLVKYFKSVNPDAVIDIGTRNIYILFNDSKKFYTIELKLSLKDVGDYIKSKGIGEKWTDKNVNTIKKYIKDIIGNKLEALNAKKVVIIKNELDFMQERGYRLQQPRGYKFITMDDYKKDNRDRLFNLDYRSLVEGNDEIETDAAKKRLYGFKNGHIILETIFDLLKVEEIIPSNELSIHGDPLSYVFQIVVSGSTSRDRDKDMIEAIDLLKKKGLTVLSPLPAGTKLEPKSFETQYQHIQALRECDLLFVCNKSDHIGQQTKREIFAAYVLNKPIALWKKSIPKTSKYNSDNLLDYIPHEDWDNIMKYLEEETENE